MNAGGPAATKRRFWAKVEKREDGCWVWRSMLNNRGYGRFHLHGKRELAHRVAWEMTHGPIPPGMLVLHSCDNPPCCNPNPGHLFLGTHSDNQNDMFSKGRAFSQQHPELVLSGDKHYARLHPERLARGERHGSHLHPDRVARGSRHGSVLCPECLPRGDRNGSRLHPERLPRGERNGYAKFTDEAVRAIRAAFPGQSKRGIARVHGVSAQAVADVLAGKTWAHVV